MKFLCLSLTQREGGRERRRAECSSEGKKNFFFLFFAKCQRVEMRSFGRWSLDGVKTFVYLLDILS